MMLARQRTEQTADGHRRPSRNQAPRDRICEGERLHPVLAGQTIRARMHHKVVGNFGSENRRSKSVVQTLILTTHGRSAK